MKLAKIKTHFLGVFLALHSIPLLADHPLPEFHNEESPFSLRHDPDRPRALFWPQLGSLLLPGLDQYLEGQAVSGVIYTGVALSGYAYAADRAAKLGQEHLKKESQKNFSSKNNDYRAFHLGMQLPMVAGSFSAYHSFRTAVRSRQKNGEFAYLEEEEKITDLLLAPLHFEFMLRKSTWIPLLIVGAIAYIENTPWALAESKSKSSPLYPSDYYYSVVPALGAGTSEEAVFRGWLMPMFHHHLKSETLSNLAQASVFALAHLGNVKVPVVQALLGYYLGEVTMRNHWTLAESVFIHTWWDVIAFLGSYSNRDRNDTAKQRPMPVLTIPIEFHF